MPDNRCFRIDESDVDELRNRTRDQRLIDAYSHWVQHFAPKVDDVITEITTAFADVRLGDGIGLHQARGLDDYASKDELRQLRARDEKTDWRRISQADLERCYAAPSFFDAQGFVFHLPAYLIAELNDQHPYGFIDRLFQTDEHPKGWRQLLTEKQRRAVISVLKLVREHPDYEGDRSAIDSTIHDLAAAPRLE